VEVSSHFNIYSNLEDNVYKRIILVEKINDTIIAQRKFKAIQTLVKNIDKVSEQINRVSPASYIITNSFLANEIYKIIGDYKNETNT